MVLYPVVISELVLHDVPVGSVRLRPGESDGVGGATQLVQHGNRGGHWGHGGKIEMRF